MEAPAATTDIQPPRKLAAAAIRIDFVSAPTSALIREYAFIPFGPFWTGRILRRIVSSEPDGH
jgi:hypothetical protein